MPETAALIMKLARDRVGRTLASADPAHRFAKDMNLERVQDVAEAPLSNAHHGEVRCASPIVAPGHRVI